MATPVRVLLLVALCLLAGGIDGSEVRIGEANPRPGSDEPVRPPSPQVTADPEFFRLQLLDFLTDAEASLLRAAEVPALEEFLRAHASADFKSIPAFETAREQISLLSPEELLPTMEIFGRAPGVFSKPELLDKAVAAIREENRRASCDDVYTERNRIEVLTQVRNGLSIGADALAVLKGISFMIYDLLNASVTTCETPVDVPTSSVQVPAVIIDAVLDILIGGLRLASDEVGFTLVPPSLCIDSCVGHGFADYHQPDTRPGLVGKGCDNRDNNCAGGIDEALEDVTPPSFSIDENLTSQCYASESDAQRFVDLAVTAADDCSSVAPDVTLAFVPAACRGVVTASARDGAQNFSSVGPLYLTIDPDPPRFVPAPLQACYPSLADARDAFSQTAVQDCTVARRSIEVEENACVAELELLAVDECDNQAVHTADVRLDGDAPVVEIDAIFLPRVDGLACFETEQEAIDVVGEATRFADNCSAISDLTVQTRASGPACDLDVESVAIDECGLLGADEVRVRVDDTPPVVTCSVTTHNLWPADDTMRDVGFSYTVADNCDGSSMDVRFEVTSDEATAYGLKVKTTNNEIDPAPDAALVRDADGSVSRILLRAQRRPDSSADGRVYRVRVIATDSCGLESFADCFVTVPHNMSTGQDVGYVYNSGQFFDATGVN